MLSFKQYNEGISVDKEQISIKFVKSDQDIINLSMGKNVNRDPYVSSGKLFYNRKIYSGYLTKSSDDINSVLLALKGKNDIEIGKDIYKQFLSRTAQYLLQTIKKLKIDIILTLDSSSPLTNDFAKEFAARLSGTIYIPNSISKASIDSIKMKDETPDNFKKSLSKVISNAKESGKDIQLKRIPGQQRSFLIDFIKINEKLLNKVKDKNVLIIDDFITSGATLAESFRLLDLLGVSEVSAVTIFKQSS